MEDTARRDGRRALRERRASHRRLKYRWWHIIGRRKWMERRDGWDRRKRVAIA